jgi:hypothetical protein
LTNQKRAAFLLRVTILRNDKKIFGKANDEKGFKVSPPFSISSLVLSARHREFSFSKVRVRFDHTHYDSQNK